MRGPENSKLVGTVKLYQTTAGVVSAVEFWGLPESEGNPGNIFTVEIMTEGEAVIARVPEVFGNRGYGWGAALSSRFTIRDVTGCTAALRVGPAVQPSGGGEGIIARGTIK